MPHPTTESSSQLKSVEIEHKYVNEDSENLGAKTIQIS